MVARRYSMYNNVTRSSVVAATADLIIPLPRSRPSASNFGPSGLNLNTLLNKSDAAPAITVVASRYSMYNNVTRSSAVAVTADLIVLHAAVRSAEKLLLRDFMDTIKTVSC